ncbi:biotin carboxyl carrier protein [Roseivirga ehrenbergii]|uniref:Acetyl-CoA carboxylase biotin carboxyl carrier protein subunit n=1 Tax=Roseivirga ehrenbergii (strain DSM 102268 / JCM 13514 / KCTC 12282 / NCIMB 14502 / KMM 6017) TaxID=279360 RepID=A0A150XPP8_ROSEK|nr:acetyl-CoA carboxylase biotin carboxyl carrier protein subunit [Roseivirga ehrenbergii]KYG80696.1 acetyl-CoA carboxylase biotin carboxyl carrier protein subunit [Roseivirga ehrenbergii]TCL07948.1 biotin carboxyl carrier protein [Roseivirga ehrenbergii]
MYKVSLKKNIEAEVKFKDSNILLNGSDFDWNISKTSKDKFQITKDGKKLNAEVIGYERENKVVEIKINNQIYNVSVKDKMDQLLQKMGITNLSSSTIKDVKAPMPGLIHDILVEVGQEVKKGDQLMILEAMKMENVLKSPGAGTIASIEISKGDSVEKNQILIKF